MKGAGFEGAEPAGASRDIVKVRGTVGVCLGPFAADCGAKAGEIVDLAGEGLLNKFRVRGVGVGDGFGRGEGRGKGIFILAYPDEVSKLCFIWLDQPVQAYWIFF